MRRPGEGLQRSGNRMAAPTESERFRKKDGAPDRKMGRPRGQDAGPERKMKVQGAKKRSSKKNDRSGSCKTARKAKWPSGSQRNGRDDEKQPWGTDKTGFKLQRAAGDSRWPTLNGTRQSLSFGRPRCR